MVRFTPADHPVEWLTAAPLWNETLNDPSQKRRKMPVLLRFASDQFMDDLIALLQRDPAELKNLVARSETWEQERVGWVPLSQMHAELNARPLKLYQPAHNRFYLVAASLVCHIPGLPDRQVHQDRQEKVSFVLRRLVQDAEYGWVAGGSRKGWFPVAQPRSVLPDEERLPLFHLNHAEGKRNRRLLAGFVPVASRETYQAAGSLSPVVVPGSTTGEPDMRVDRLENRVQTPLTLLISANSTSLTDSQVKEISTFILLDLAELLSEFFPDVWAWVLQEISPDALHNRPNPPPAAKIAFYESLTAKIHEGDETTWAAALRTTWTNRAKILDIHAPHPEVYVENLRGASVATIKKAMDGALPLYSLPEQISDPPDLPKIDPDTGDFYVLRCVYERPVCKDLHPAVVSEATFPFQLAGFFDPEAPVRQLRIVMPKNTSIAGLRKFKKGVAFVVSDQLRTQMERFKGLKMRNLDDEDIPSKSSPYTLGKICSFSIPIITICALILLFIIVQLLNIIFWWIPFLKICFPIKRR